MAWAQRFTAQPSTPLEHDDADLYANPAPHRDGLSPRPRSPMSGFGSAHFTTAIQPAGQLRRRGTNRDRHGSLCIPSCLVSRLSSPKAAFNPHTSTALAAYCKSPYPHRSAPAASPTAYSCERSAVDTALEIWHQAEFSVRQKRFTRMQEISVARGLQDLNSLASSPPGSIS